MICVFIVTFLRIKKKAGMLRGISYFKYQKKRPSKLGLHKINQILLF